MTAYADWNLYKKIFLLGREPSISETDFPFWERRARSHVDAVTFNRLHDPDKFEQHREAVILCVCELAEYYSTDAVRESKGLSSVSITGQSLSFDKNANAKEIREIVNRNLANTGLLYSGVG